MTWEEYDAYHNNLKEIDRRHAEREAKECHEYYQEHYTYVNGHPVWREKYKDRRRNY